LLQAETIEVIDTGALQRLRSRQSKSCESPTKSEKHKNNNKEEQRPTQGGEFDRKAAWMAGEKAGIKNPPVVGGIWRRDRSLASGVSFGSAKPENALVT
jgi:hypothetical protein